MIHSQLELIAMVITVGYVSSVMDSEDQKHKPNLEDGSMILRFITNWWFGIWLLFFHNIWDNPSH